MTTSYTPNRNYSLPATGDDVNTWGPVINGNFTAIDNNISNGVDVSTTGGITTLNSTQYANLLIQVVGTLASNATIVLPFHASMYFVQNQTSGAFTLTLSAAGGGGTSTLSQSSNGIFWTDGTTVYKMSSNETVTPVIPSGTVMSFLQATAPVGWTQSNAFNDAVIRLVNNTGTGGATGGAWTISGGSVGGHALTISEMPSHNHTIQGQWANGNGTSNPGINGGNPPDTNNNSTDYTGGGAAHTHPLSFDGTWRPAYINALVAQKN